MANSRYNQGMTTRTATPSTTGQALVQAEAELAAATTRRDWTEVARLATGMPMLERLVVRFGVDHDYVSALIGR